MNTEQQKAGSNRDGGAKARHLTATLSPVEAEREGDEFLIKRELAARLKVSVRTVEQWQHDGHLPYLRISGVLLFHWPAVVKALTEKFTIRRGGTSTPARPGEKLKAEILKTEISAKGKPQGGRP